MTRRNPWIDPRVEQVYPAAARDYLKGHGWKLLPVDQANLEPYAAPGTDDIVSVPLAERGRDYVQRVIELITAVALVENRYAVDVLNDILSTSAEKTNSVPAASAPAR